MRREIAALMALAVVLIAAAVAFFIVDIGPETTPVQRSDEQNSGVKAPSEQAPSPGVVEDQRGDPALPQGD